MFSVKRSRFILLCSLFLSAALLIGLPGRSSRSSAQTNPISAAPGYQINIFADASLIPDFNGGSFGFGPVSLAFDSKGRLFVGTLAGNIYVVLDTNDDGVGDQIKLFASGITQPYGIEFAPNGDLYATSNYQRASDGAFTGKIVRLRDTNGDDVADDITTIVDGLPAAGPAGDGGLDRLKFGPDGMLYFGLASTTDNGTPVPGRPVDGPLNRAFLRIDVNNPPANGQLTKDNVFATGFRNPFGMAFDPVSGGLFCTDEGQGELNVTPPPGLPDAPDEINYVTQGGNYGFPGCNGTPDPQNPTCDGVTAPLYNFFPLHLTPTSISFYTGPQAGSSANHMLVTVLKRLGPIGGDLEQFVLTGNTTSGFQLTPDPITPQVANFGIIDPNDGPVDSAIDPISGDIYVSRVDVVNHKDPTEHHNFIYRIHRTGSDSQPFIGPVTPSQVTAGSGAATITLTGKHLKPDVAVLADGQPLTTTLVGTFQLSAEIPASLTATPHTISITARNADWMTSNAEQFEVVPAENPPQLASLTVRKKSGKIIKTLFVGAKAKKLSLIVDGSGFDQGAQLLVNGSPLALVSSSSTELIGAFTQAMVASPGNLNVQVKNSSGLTSNTLQLAVAAASVRPVIAAGQLVRYEAVTRGRHP